MLRVASVNFQDPCASCNIKTIDFKVINFISIFKNELIFSKIPIAISPFASRNKFHYLNRNSKWPISMKCLDRDALHLNKCVIGMSVSSAMS